MGPETETRAAEPVHEGTELEKETAESSRIEQWSKALERPAVGASVAGALFAAVAGAWGPTEAVLGAGAGLLVYRMLKRRTRNAADRDQRGQAKEQPVH